MSGHLRRFAARVRLAFGSRRAEDELAREVAAHLALLEDDYRRRGLTADDARFAARRAIGGVEQTKELHRDARAFAWLSNAQRDIRFALRSLARHRGFTALTIVTLGLGIGAATAVYAAFDAAFLRPLPFPHAERLVRLNGVQVPVDLRGLVDAADAAARPAPVRTQADVSDLHAMREVFSSTAVHATGAANLDGGVEPVRVDVTFVTGEFFTTLGRRAALGREFTAAEAASGGPRVTVLSDRLWRTQFGADPAIVGQQVRLDAVPHEVVGVMPPDFRFPAHAQLWVPLTLPAPMSTIMGSFRNFFPSQLVARMAPGITVPVAAQRLEAVRRHYATAAPKKTAAPAIAPAELVVPLQRSLIGDRRTVLAVLMASAGLVLLIACANAATLLLSRAAGRRREMATHAALGATRGRLLARLLLESVLLSAAAALLGLVIARASLSLLTALLPPGLAGLAPLQVDVRVLGFTIGAAGLTGILFGLWPAIGSSRLRIGSSLNTGARAVAGSRRLMSGLVVAQVAIACLLAIGAGLMTASLRSLLGTNVGMQIDRVATARVNLPATEYRDAAALGLFIRSTLTALDGASGVESASAINTLPLAREQGIGLRLDPEGREPAPNAPRFMAPFLVVAPGYFRTMGMALLRGRDLDWSDREGAPVAVINTTAARQLWPGDNPLGRRFVFGGGGPARTVVGVVEDARISDLSVDAGAQVYLPIQEQPQNYLSFVIRGTPETDVAALPERIRAAVRATGPSVPIYAALPMNAVAGDLVAARRVNTMLIGAFAALALGLAAIGVYGVLACSVAQRARELGVRVALGAQRREVLGLVLRQGLMLIAGGLVVGMIIGVAATRYLQTLLYGVTPRDPATFAAVAVVLAAVGLLAAFVPARRAAAADPLAVLRAE